MVLLIVVMRVIADAIVIAVAAADWGTVLTLTSDLLLLLTMPALRWTRLIFGCRVMGSRRLGREDVTVETRR